MGSSTGGVARSSLGAFTEDLASDHPTPGGGSAVAVVAALAASLVSMVVRLSLDRPRYTEHAELLSEAKMASDAARSRLLLLADDDADAYAAYRAARGMAHDTDAQEKVRDAATREAARLAAAVPLELVGECHRLIDLVERLAGRTNVNARSDLEVAALLLEAAARGAAANVRVNLEEVGDEGYSDAVTAELDQRLQRVQRASDRTHELIAKGALRPAEGA